MPNLSTTAQSCVPPDDTMEKLQSLCLTAYNPPTF
jgi:hypothetical protein